MAPEGGGKSVPRGAHRPCLLSADEGEEARLSVGSNVSFLTHFRALSVCVKTMETMVKFSTIKITADS